VSSLALPTLTKGGDGAPRFQGVQRRRRVAGPLGVGSQTPGVSARGLCAYV
jgi:hypothetical protein